jgi:diketogulonate reductase-like aldo/keto reductase
MVARPETVDRSDSGHDEIHRLEENLGAVKTQLTADDLRDINAAAAKIEVQGARLPEAVLKMSES